MRSITSNIQYTCIIFYFTLGHTFLPFSEYKYKQNPSIKKGEHYQVLRSKATNPKAPHTTHQTSHKHQSRSKQRWLISLDNLCKSFPNKSINQFPAIPAIQAIWASDYSILQSKETRAQQRCCKRKQISIYNQITAREIVFYPFPQSIWWKNKLLI